jgi:hypothetical protein
MRVSLSPELLRRRERLLLRSAQLREDWSQQVQVLRAPLGLADQARAGVQWLAHHPQWPLGAALLIVLLRPGRALRWASYAWQGYGVYRRVQRVLARAPLGMHPPAR